MDKFLKSEKIRQMAISILVIIIFIIITYALLSVSTQHKIIAIDKVYHFAVFFSLSFSITLIRPRFAIWVLFGAMVLGGLIELSQTFTAREASWEDFIADVTGTIFGIMISRYIGSWLFGPI
tara:strand:- start:59 stop:424 length:366 start_codon:yes stop_codon:yes gene_type:complete